MRVHLYAVCWNEAPMLGFFFRHYEALVERFVVYDNNSSDGSRAILEQRPDVEIRPFPHTHRDSFVLSAQMLQDRCWKESRGSADWVIVTAVDEHLYHPRLPEYLARCRRRGVTYMPALGFQMLTRDFPRDDEHLATTRTKGAPHALMSKLRIWNPDAVDETNLGIGGHNARPTGRLRLPWRDELLLLHYKYLGFERAHARSSELDAARGAADRANGWGEHYRPERVDEEWGRFVTDLVDLSDPRYVPWIDHTDARWWRDPPDRAARLRLYVEQVRATVTRVPSSGRGRAELS